MNAEAFCFPQALVIEVYGMFESWSYPRPAHSKSWTVYLHLHQRPWGIDWDAFKRPGRGVSPFEAEMDAIFQGLPTTLLADTPPDKDKQ